MFDEPVRCSLLTDGAYSLEMADSGDKLSKNEIEDLVDIGRDRWQYKWPAEKKTLTWNFKSYTPDVKSRYQQQRTWSQIFRTMGFIIPRKFKYDYFNDEKTDITIAHLMNPDAFSGATVLAHAYLFHPNGTKNGVIEFNDSRYFLTPFGDSLPAYMVDHDNYTEGERWSNGRLKTLATWSELHIGMHEGKHMMGYRHDMNSPESIMYPYAKKGTNQDGSVNRDAFIWTDDDIKRWEEGYGRRNFSIRKLNYFRRSNYID